MALAASEDQPMAGADIPDDEALLDYEGDSDVEAMDQDTNAPNPMAALLDSARARAAEFDNEGVDDSASDSWDGFEATNSSVPIDSSRHAFDKAFQEVVSASDVVLYVLDARDPLGTRSRATELAITSSPDKRLILLLNKIDLIPASNLTAWLTHLRRSFPTLPIRSSAAAPNAHTFDHAAAAHSPATLLRALKSYGAARSFKRALNVGVIGYPNVGKSSVINALSLRLSKPTPCPVGAEAGVTTAMRVVKLDGNLRLLDCPGIVFDAGSATGKRAAAEHARLVLLNAVPPRDIHDPVAAVALLLRKLGKDAALNAALAETYALPALLATGKGDRTTDFLVQVARKRGRLGKGGVPNLHAAAVTVVGDWREGRVRGWSEVPAVEAEGDAKEIVQGWAKEFNLDEACEAMQ